MKRGSGYLAAALCALAGSRGHALAEPVAAPTAAAATTTGASTEAGALSLTEAMRLELVGLGLQPQCSVAQGVSTCLYAGRSSMTERKLRVRASYRAASNTVLLEVLDFMRAPVDDPATAPLLQRLVALNWGLLAARFAWHADTGEIRLAATLHTDTNFDRRAFRSLVRALDDLAPRYQLELRNLQQTLQRSGRPAVPTRKP